MSRDLDVLPWFLHLFPGVFAGRQGDKRIHGPDDHKLKNPVSQRIACGVGPAVDVDESVNGVGEPDKEYDPSGTG